MTSASGSGLNKKNLGNWLLILEAHKSITGLNLKYFNTSLKIKSFSFYSVLVSATLDSLHLLIHLKYLFFSQLPSPRFFSSVSRATDLQLPMLFIPWTAVVLSVKILICVSFRSLHNLFKPK